MEDGKPPFSVSSSAWTGPPSGGSHDATNRGYQPPLDPAEQRTQAVALYLLGGCLLAFLVWYFVLGSLSAIAPSPETGHTEALNLFSARARPIYVRPAEALITYTLLVAAFVVPVGYVLGSEALRRRSKR